jgi:hypothetical protein
MPDIFTANKPVEDVPQGQSEQPPQPQAEMQPSQQPEVQSQPIPQEGEAHAVSQQPAATPVVSKRLSTSLPLIEGNSSPGLFNAYCLYPKGITFINQEDGEKLLLFLRRHFITNVPWILLTILFLFVPPIITTIFAITNFAPFLIPPQMTFVIITFYYLAIVNYALGKFIVWFYHVGIVTHKRLLDLDVDNILTYHLAETEMRDIVDVSYSQKGFFQSFFNFGNVPIQTEAIKANFEFEEAPHPAEVADIITDLRPHSKGDKGGN